jgi:hypothetical protein
MAIAVDTSTPALKTNSATTAVSNSFSPPANSLLVIVYMSPNTTTISSITDSLGGHLTYTLRKGNHGTGDCNTEIWVADCPSSQTGMTVTATLGVSVYGTIGIVVLTGAIAAASQTGATNNASSFGAAPTSSVTTTANGSLVIGTFGTRLGTTPAAGIPGGQTDTFGSSTLLAQDGNGTYEWVQTTTAPTSSSGTSVTINNTTSCEFDLALVEILAGAAPAVPAGVVMAPLIPT